MGDYQQVDDDKKIILITGFGPFTGHPVNASWETVKELSKIGLSLDSDKYKLIIQEIPVTYAAVSSKIPQLWKELKPHLIVHVGVSHLAQELTLEKVAHNNDYIKKDIDGKVVDSCCCMSSGLQILRSDLNLDLICDSVNNDACSVMAVTSTDAGRYLCEFIYYTSLHQDNKRVVFIHVPPLGKPHDATQLAIGIQAAISAMLKQLN